MNLCNCAAVNLGYVLTCVNTGISAKHRAGERRQVEWWETDTDVNYSEVALTL
jgi:hypothetical protein